MASLQDLTNQLKQSIIDRNSLISARDSALVEKLKAMNKTAVEILNKVKNLSNSSDNFRQQLAAKEVEITALKETLENTTRDQNEKQKKIDELSMQLEKAQAEGQNADALKAEIAQLQTDARNNSDKIGALTKEITDSAQEIQKIIADINSPENQEELKRLIDELEKYINDINAALPEPAPAIALSPGQGRAQEEVIEGSNLASSASIPRKKREPIFPQRVPTPEELQIINNPMPTPAEAAQRKALMDNPSLNEWRKNNTTNSTMRRGGYIYKTRKNKANSGSWSNAPSSSARRSTNSRRGFKKQGGSRRRRRVKAVII